MTDKSAMIVLYMWVVLIVHRAHLLFFQVYLATALRWKSGRCQFLHVMDKEAKAQKTLLAPGHTTGK